MSVDGDTDRLFTRIPISIITGYLGSGKTTLLQEILRERKGEKIALIINEFGAVNIDAQILETSEEEIIELDNGCICCTVRGDLVPILTRLVEGRLGMRGEARHFDRVIIETSGLADPGPIITTLYTDAVLSSCYTIDSVITLVDAVHFDQYGTSHESAAQIAFADTIVITKGELVSDVAFQSLRSRLQSTNQSARILDRRSVAAGVGALIGTGSFAAIDLPPVTHDHAEHQHDAGVDSVVISLGAVNLDVLHEAFSTLLTKYPGDLYRYKGIVAVAGDEQRYVLQGVRELYSISPDRLWAEGEERRTLLVLIGRNTESMQKLFTES